MKVCVVIPAYNEAKTIGDILAALKEKGFDILVIDDGSTDNTGEIAANLGVMLIRHKENIGKGASMKEGTDFILKNTNCDAIITMDGDGQHKVGDIDNFIKMSEKEGSDIIVGNRMGYTKNMPFARLATNVFTSFLISGICKQKIPDTQCGFRLIKRKVIEAVDLVSTNYDTESEILIDAAQRGFKISSIPIKTIYKGERSDIHPVKDTIRFFALVIRTYFFGKQK